MNYLFNYLQTRKKKRLYRQWVDKAGLPPEAVPREIGKVSPAQKRKPQLLRLLFYILLGAAVALLLMVLALFLEYSC